MKHFFRMLTSGLAISLLGSCSSYKEATGPEAMWYQFTFEAEYQGKTFKIDQMVTCMRQRISGGFLGQSPDTQIHENYPRTAAATMYDGSQVLVRIPNMCSTHRAYKLNPVTMKIKFKPGWHSAGPHEVTPLLIWSDSTTNPTRVESYIARSYYTHPEARVKEPKGAVILWSAGKFPENYKELMEKEEALPFYPHPNIREGERSTKYLGKGPQFMAFLITPISDPIGAWEKYTPQLNRRINEASVPKAPPIGTIQWDDENFTLYNRNSYDDAIGKYVPLTDYIYAGCVKAALSSLLTGGRAMVGPTLNESMLITSYRPDIRTLKKNDPETQEIMSVEAIWKKKDRNCYKQLGEARSFEIINGRFDASEAIPGRIVYRRWGNPSRKDYRADGTSIPPVLRKMDLADKQAIYFRIEGRPILINLYKDYYYLKSKNTNSWYYLSNIHGMYGGKSELGGFN